MYAVFGLNRKQRMSSIKKRKSCKTFILIMMNSQCIRVVTFLFGENGMSPNSLSASRTGVDRCYRNGIYNVYTVRGDDKAAVEIQIRRETWKYSL